MWITGCPTARADKIIIICAIPCITIHRNLNGNIIVLLILI